MIKLMRLQAALAKQAVDINRFGAAAGATATGSIRVVASIGSLDQVGTQNFSSLTFAAVTGAAPLSVQISRTTNLLLLASYTAKLTVGTNNGYVRINPGAAGGLGATWYWGAPYFATLHNYWLLYGVQPGNYTMTLEAAVDNVASTLQLIASNLTVLQLAG